MSNYTKTTDFATKDTLTPGDPNKVIKGTEFETEFDNISTAISTKADTENPTFSGTVALPASVTLGGSPLTVVPEVSSAKLFFMGGM